MRPGLVSLVGAGPGDPYSLTLAGREALERADVLVYDKLVPARLLEWARPEAERLFVGKEAGNKYLPQSQINQILIDQARLGKRVVRLKGGDPLIFGRGAEELEALSQAGIPYEVLPGVTAALGSAATTGIPLTHRGEASVVTFVTGHDDPAKPEAVDWKRLAQQPGTLVIYMARSKIGSIAQQLLQGGMRADMPVAFVQWGGCARQRVHVTTLATAVAGAPEEIGTPMIAIIGAVVNYRDQLAWFERKPLFGQTILLARAEQRSEAILRRLHDLGAEVLSEPVFDIAPASDTDPLDRTLDRVGEFAWLVFTSRNGARMFCERLLARGLDVRRLGGVRLAAVGPGTAEELRRYALQADLIPSTFRAESLAEELSPLVKGRSVLLVRGEQGRDVLQELLGSSAAQIESVVVYRQVERPAPSAETLERLRSGAIGWVFLSSSNMARGFLAWLDEDLAGVVREKVGLVSISPLTSDAIRSAGFSVAVEAREHTLDGMADALVEHLQI